MIAPVISREHFFLSPAIAALVPPSHARTAAVGKVREEYAQQGIKEARTHLCIFFQDEEEEEVSVAEHRGGVDEEINIGFSVISSEEG